MKSLHIFLNTAQSGRKPGTSMSYFTLSLQYKTFLFLPLHLTPVTCTFLQADSPTPNHPLFHAQAISIFYVSPHSSTLCIPERLSKSTQRCRSFNDTPFIHLTIIRSVVSRLCRFSAIIGHVSFLYVNTL